MSRYALIQDGEVVNVVVWDGKTEFTPEGELVALTDDEVVGPGWARKGNKWIAPPLDAITGADGD
jgi:hypothetical protein